MPCILCTEMSESAKAYAHLVPTSIIPALLVSTHVILTLMCFTEISFLFVIVYKLYACLCVRAHVHVCVCVCVSLCLLTSISPGQGDTGISRDEPQIEEAVIGVFKKVRGGLIQVK